MKENGILESLNGLSVEGINHYYYQRRLVVLFESSITLSFFDCPLAIDSGIIGSKISKASLYKGEMGFVLAFRDMQLSQDDFKYCILEANSLQSYQKQLRIAFKNIEISKIASNKE